MKYYYIVKVPIYQKHEHFSLPLVKTIRKSNSLKLTLEIQPLPIQP
jgi:hypothetical protein